MGYVFKKNFDYDDGLLRIGIPPVNVRRTQVPSSIPGGTSCSYKEKMLKKTDLVNIPDYSKLHTLPSKERAQTDFKYLAQEILGYKYDDVKHKGFKGNDLVHKMMLETMDADTRFKLMLFFRGSYKTTFMIIKSIQRLINNFEDTILYCGDAWEHARNIGKEVRNHIMYNEKLLHLFGNFIPELNKKSNKTWNRDYWDIAQRKNPTGSKEPSFATAGTEKEITGRHPDLLIFDDIVGPKNVTTAEQRQKIIDYIIQAIPLLGISGELIMVGTPWAYDDAYHHVQTEWLGKKDADGSPLFSYARMGIINDDGEPTMPSVYNRAAIESLKSTIPSFEWCTQYLCDPVAEGSTLIQRKDVLTYTSLPFPNTSNFDVWITIDPAISLDRKKCWTGIVCGVPVAPYYLYIDRAERLKVLPQDLITSVLDIIDGYDGRVRAVGIEEQSFQKIYEGSLINELRKRMFECPSSRRISVIPLVANDNKHSRIYGLEPYFRHHQIYVQSGCEHMLNQLYRYPRLSEHNLDLIDALAYQLQILPPIILNNPYGIIKPVERINKRPGAFYDSGLYNEAYRSVSW